MDHTIQLKDGRTLGFSEYGDLKGQPIFYFHGWPTSRLQARYIDSAAKKLKIRLISIDRPGYGLSSFKKNRTLLQWSDDVTEFADKLSIKTFGVMGVSGGGPYAAVCAYRIPKRLTRVAIVVGLAPTYIPGLLDNIPLISKIGWEGYAKIPFFRTMATLLHYLTAKYGPAGLYRYLFAAKADREVYLDPRVREATKKNFQESFKNGYKGVELDLKLYTTNWGFNIREIKAKVFLFYGEEDKSVSLAMGKYYASQIQNSRLKMYPGEGHLISRTHIDEILRTLIR